MPSKTAKQHNLMQAKCHGTSTKKNGPSKKVACEFVRADARKGTPTKKGGK